MGIVWILSFRRISEICQFSTQTEIHLVAHLVAIRETAAENTTSECFFLGPLWWDPLGGPL